MRCAVPHDNHKRRSINSQSTLEGPYVPVLENTHGSTSDPDKHTRRTTLVGKEQAMTVMVRLLAVIGHVL